MYSCYIHGWSSHHSMCPSCEASRTQTSSGTIYVNKMLEPNLPLNDHDTYEKAIAELESEVRSLLSANTELSRDRPQLIGKLREMEKLRDLVIENEDKYKSALKMLEEMAAIISELRTVNQRGIDCPSCDPSVNFTCPECSVDHFAYKALENYRKFKENTKW